VKSTGSFQLRRRGEISRLFKSISIQALANEKKEINNNRTERKTQKNEVSDLPHLQQLALHQERKRNKMRKFAWLFALLAALPVFAQPTPTSIKGVKVISTSFDPATDKKSITFVNDSTSDITAYDAVAVETYDSGFTGKLYSPHELLTPGYRSVDLKHRPFLPEVPPKGDVIHPGQTATMEWGDRFADAGSPVRAALSLDVVVFANAAAETTDLKRLNRFATDRRYGSQINRKIIAIAQRILDDSGTTDQNALILMRDQLRNDSDPYIQANAGDFNEAVSAGTFKGGLVESIVFEHNKRKETIGQKQMLREFIHDKELIAAELEQAANIKVVTQ